MNAQQEAIALWKHFESRGMRPSVRAIGRTLRDVMGLKFRESELRKWLSDFSGRVPDATRTQHIKEGDAVGTQSGRDFARAAKVSLVSNSVESNDSTQRAPKQQRLGFDRALFDARNAILKAVWANIQPLIGVATTYSTWRARNSRIAADLAGNGWTPERVVVAWQQASTVRGEPVRELSIVQRHIERVAAAVASRRPSLRAVAQC